MKNRRRVFAAILCAVVALSMLVSSAYMVREATHHHRCTGEHCPICQFIAHLEQLRRAFGTALLALLLVCFVLALRRERRAWAALGVPALRTLVGRKIRLND